MERVAARTFRDLIVWQRAHALVLQVYRHSVAFPKTETYGLVSQIRRAAVSIPANIAKVSRRVGAPTRPGSSTSLRSHSKKCATTPS